jgi:rare lipoprotein A (peptidoglycan hydrolase)
MNQANGQSVVEVDRGPFVKSRDIDLSKKLSWKLQK